MKKRLPLLMVLILLFAGCGAENSAPVSTADSKPASSTNQASPANSVNSNESSSTAVAANTASVSGVDVNITEKMYVTYINEVYTNVDDYIGKTIQIEGMFEAYYAEETKTTYYYVYRTGPGCCGNDGSMCGFEFTWSGEMPKGNDWIQVIGTLRTYTEGEDTYLTLDAQSVTVLEKRGAETVYQ